MYCHFAQQVSVGRRRVPLSQSKVDLLCMNCVQLVFFICQLAQNVSVGRRRVLLKQSKHWIRREELEARINTIPLLYNQMLNRMYF